MLRRTRMPFVVRDPQSFVSQRESGCHVCLLRSVRKTTTSVVHGLAQSPGNSHALTKNTPHSPAMIGLGLGATTRKRRKPGPRAPKYAVAPQKPQVDQSDRAPPREVPQRNHRYGGRLLASIGFIVTPGMIFTMAGKVDICHCSQAGQPLPLVQCEGFHDQHISHRALGPDSMGGVEPRSRRRIFGSQERTSK